MSTFTKTAGRLLRVLPGEGKAVKTAVRKVLVRKELLFGRMRQHLAGVSLPDPRTVYSIDPRRIEYATCLDNGSPDWEDWVLPQQGSVQPVRGGDWDALRHRVSEMRICQAVQARVRHGTAWSSSDYYAAAVRQIESGRMLWGCRSRADFDAHCARIDKLIESISRDGYRSAAERPGDARIDTATGHTEVLVNLSRDGLPLFQDGRHRLAIALALGLPNIPVQIFVRHAEWQAFREYLLRMAGREDGGASSAGFLYQRAEHFDLADIPAAHGCEDRWQAICGYLPTGAGGRALDIGCNLGFICHRLEEQDYEAVGIEYLPEVAYAARRIAKAAGRCFGVIQGDVLDEATLRPAGTDFDVVVALSIFHHFIKTESGYRRLRELLGRLRIGTLFFEPHRPDESQMQGAYANPGPEEFAELVAGWAGMNRIEPIYTADDGRIVFAIKR